jgi:hypothetical protein
MATARKTKDRKFPQTEFEMPLAEAVALLIAANQIEPDDRWSFHVSGGVLQITRIRATEQIPIDPEQASPRQ